MRGQCFVVSRRRHRGNRIGRAPRSSVEGQGCATRRAAESQEADAVVTAGAASNRASGRRFYLAGSRRESLQHVVPVDPGQVDARLPDSKPDRLIDLVAIVVHDYDPAIRFFVDILGFELAEDSPSLTTDGRPKRWVVVRPPGAQTGLLLARADGERQSRVVGDQFAGRVGLFFRVDHFDAHYERMIAAGVEFVRPPREEAYGRVAVFLDIAGNRWDLIGPRPGAESWS
jgi:catechol 2,3-dioxygenase-like lactoylglutathione lyase family enzyme